LLRELEVLPPAMNERDRARPYETLERWGIVTLGDLAALSAADLASRLGRRGAALQQLARGLDLRPFVPDRETRRFVERLELEWPIDALEPLSFVFARLLDPLSDALERADRGAVAIRLELRLTDRSTCTRVLPLPAPMRDARVLRTLLLLALESHPPPAGIDIVSIELDPAPARIVWFSLLDRALPSPETLATLTARLSALVGESRVGSATLLDSHAPDAYEMTRFAPDSAARSHTPDLKVGLPGGSRRDAGSVLRRQRIPAVIRVAVERGRPVHIATSRRGTPYGGITDAAGPWRTSGEWWTKTNWNRNEWDVALKSGAVCRIYQDRATDRWFLEGVYD
jgi:protein ImuB